MFPLPEPPVPRRPTSNRDLVTWLVILVALSALACDDEKALTAPGRMEPRIAATASAQATIDDVTPMGRIPLPINQTFSGGLAFGITQTGAGRAGLFRITNTSSFSSALDALTNGQAPALRVTTDGSGGHAGQFLTTRTSNNAAVIDARSEGTGPAGRFVINNPNSIRGAIEAFKRGGRGFAIDASISGSHPNFVAAVARLIVDASSSGIGVEARNAGSGPAGVFSIPNGQSGFSTIEASTIGSGWAGDFRGRSKGVKITTDAGGTGLQVVGGSKNAVVATTTGARALYSEEATEVWFADYGFGKLENGRTRILIDPGFAQTVSLDEPYHVFVQPYGDAELYVEDRTSLGFVVRVRDGDANVEFGYRVVAKRQGFESARLERAPWADNSPAFATHSH